MTAAVSSSLPPVLTPVPTPAAPAPNQNGFAQMLKARQAEAPAPEKPAAAPEAEVSPRHPATQAARSTARPPARPVADAGRPEAAAGRTVKGIETAVAVDPKLAERTIDIVTDTDTDMHEVDPALVDWMANLNLPVDVAAPVVSTGLPRQPVAEQGEQDASDGALLLADEGGEGGRLKAVPGAERDRAGAGKGIASGELRDTPQLGRETLPGSSSAAWQQEAARVLVEAPELAPQGLRPEASVGLAGLVLSAGQPVAGRASETPAPVVVTLPTPVDSPEFPQALGTQLSMLARDGVQHAELHLNPSDMGPISVQIELNGSRAHVDFGADSAATRDIIENGLPELAAALRDAGFTLSGGGVHQQAQQGSGQREGESGRRGETGAEGGTSTNEVETAAQARSHARMAAGGVDLYA